MVQNMKYHLPFVDVNQAHIGEWDVNIFTLVVASIRIYTTKQMRIDRKLELGIK